MSDLINRQVLDDGITQLYNHCSCPDQQMLDLVCEIISEVPAVDAVQVVLGKWEQDGIYQRCSKCLANFATEDSGGDELIFNYCPHCGAKMDGGKS